MEQVKSVITIPFKPLLAKICSYLGLPQPIYHHSELGVDTCIAFVCGPIQPHGYLFYGKDAQNFEESAEDAARQMVLFLVKRFKVRADDVNLGVVNEHDAVAADFRLKKSQIEYSNESLPGSSVDNEAVFCMVGSGPPAVSIDFFSLLGIIVANFNIPVTRVEYVHLGMGCYRAWMSVVTPNGITNTRWIRSEECPSITAAKQSVSKAAIRFLQCYYNFEVNDVNYHMMHYSGFKMQSVRDTYLAVRERVLGAPLDSAARPSVEEEFVEASQDLHLTLPTVLPNSVPPKKRACPTAGRSFTETMPPHMRPDKLAAVVPRRKEVKLAINS